MQQSLEDLLIQTKLISAPQLAVAQRDAGIRNKPLAQTLIDLGFVSDRKFAEWVANVTKLPIVDPLRSDVVSEFEANVPPEVARQHEVVALDVNADEMTVAIVNPLDKASVDAIAAATGMKIQPVIAIYGQLAEMVNMFYPSKPAFDPSKTIAAGDIAPFNYGDDTMLRMHSQEFAFKAAAGDDSLGSDTRVMPPPKQEAVKQQESQLDRIEQLLENLQRRIDAIDATLARILNRQ